MCTNLSLLIRAPRPPRRRAHRARVRTPRRVRSSASTSARVEMSAATRASSLDAPAIARVVRRANVRRSAPPPRARNLCRARENYAGEREQTVDKSPATYDKLVNVFDKREEKDWIALLAFSGKWKELRVGTFERCAERARMSENPDDEMRLSKLRRKLMALDERVEAYETSLAEAQQREREVWEGFVATRRREFTVEFFTWLRYKLEAVAQSGDDEAKEQLTKDAALLLSLCEAYDEAVKDQAVIEQATQTLQDILQADSLDAMDAKIDELAMTNQITPALILTASKAYMSVKESPYTKDEVKDVMAHLYFKMKDTTTRQQPKEVRILKYILTMEDPIDQRNALEEAFTPGPELEEANTDLLWCEPSALINLIDVITDNFYQSAGKKNLRGDAAAMMSPALVERMKSLKQLIIAHFSD